jgi:hypothetical protein
MARPKNDENEGTKETPPVFADKTQWLYHKTEPPKVFKKGDTIPDGWDSDNRRFWTFNDYGQWELSK